MPKYSRRYVVVHCEDRTEAERNQWGDSGSFLVDTATDEVVFSDDMEICDATLARGIGELVSILNHQAALLDISRESALDPRQAPLYGALVTGRPGGWAGPS